MSTAASSPATDGAPNDMVGRWLGELDGKLEELRPAHDQFVELMSFRARLTGDIPSSAPPARGRGSRSSSSSNNSSSATRSTGGGSQGGGTRKDEFLALVRQRPGLTVKDACETMGVQENYLYRIRKDLKNEDLIRIDGSQIYPVDQTQAQLDARTAELAAAGGRK